VRPTGQRFTVVAGHRRFAAWCRCATEAPSDPRWRSIDVIVRDIGQEEALTLMLVENLERKALSPLEEAITLQRVRLERGWTNRQVADAVHRSEMYVSRRLRILDDESLRDAVLNGHLTVTTAEELLACADRSSLVARAIAEQWTPAEVRQVVRAGGLRRRSRDDSTQAVSGKEPAANGEAWRTHLAALGRLLDSPTGPPPELRVKLAATARRLLARCEA
jgi:ParB/RepB/Spo0J family partition protein